MKGGVIVKNTQKTIASLHLTLLEGSYPVLKNIKYFRELNSLLEDNFNQRLNKLKKEFDGSGYYEGKNRILSLQDIKIQSEQLTYNSFQQLIRSSLLITLCSFIENVFTNRVFVDERLKNKYDNLKEGSILNKARTVLIENGYSELKDLRGMKYVNDMNWIRNSFVHYKGKAVNDMKTIEPNYDFSIVNFHIVLGEKFIGNYIYHLEKFAVEVAKIIYENEWNESLAYKKYKEYCERNNLSISLESNHLINFFKHGLV